MDPGRQEVHQRGQQQDVQKQCQRGPKIQGVGDQGVSNQTCELFCDECLPTRKNVAIKGFIV